MSKPDGYTLFLGSDALFEVNPHIYGRMAVDPMKDFVPVGKLISNQLILAVNPDRGAGERLPRASSSSPRAPSRRCSMPRSATAAMHHLAMEMLKQTVKIDLTHVPYKGGGPAGSPWSPGE